MPFFVTHKYLQKVFTQHLRSGKEALVVTKCGALGIIVIKIITQDKNKIKYKVNSDLTALIQHLKHYIKNKSIP
jgi:phosphatidylserine/phosphatidylglycerophosphate/cardiolipin synthase-like enzyme